MVQAHRLKPRLLLLCGPTGVGKTATAIGLAQRLGTDILSADSMQIYRGLDIGSAKPTPAEQARARHHLIDIAAPDESYSVAKYREDFERCLDEHFLGRSAGGEAARKVPLVCGGTGLYFNAILYQYDFAGAFDDGSVRAELKARAERDGREALFRELQTVDPETAAVLSVNDEKRVIRALEIFRLTGKKKSEFAPKLTDRYDFTVIGLNRDRQELYKMIDNRVLCMFRQGLVEEVEGLLARGVDERCQSMQAIGYKETLRYLRGACSREEAVAEIQQASRNYAKRQITWFKRLPGITWLSPEDDGLVDGILARYAADVADAANGSIRRGG